MQAKRASCGAIYGRNRTFKNDDFVFTAGGSSDRIICFDPGSQTGGGDMFRIRTSSSGSSNDAAVVFGAFFGELENE